MIPIAVANKNAAEHAAFLLVHYGQLRMISPHIISE
jgi:hypothetical protein